jgi:hypothetical protein
MVKKIHKIQKILLWDENNIHFAIPFSQDFVHFLLGIDETPKE